MRQTCKEIEVNVAYRWFLGLDMLDKVPHFSTFGKNYTRRFKDTDLFEQIFERILFECYKYKFVDPSEAYDALNRFRCEEGVWQWNEDDARDLSEPADQRRIPSP